MGYSLKKEKVNEKEINNLGLLGRSQWMMNTTHFLGKIKEIKGGLNLHHACKNLDENITVSRIKNNEIMIK